MVESEQVVIVWDDPAVVVLTGLPAGGFDAQELLRFVLRARVDLVCQRVFQGGDWLDAPKSDRVSQNQLAKRMGWTPAALSRFVNRGQMGKFTREHLLDLEYRLLVFEYEHRNVSRQAAREFGWLTSFADEIFEGRWPQVKKKPGRNSDDGTFPHAPATSPSTMLARWHDDLAEAGPHNAAEALVLGEALIGLQRSAGSAHAANVIWEKHHRAANRTLRALVSTATKPASAGAEPAIHLAALLGHHAVPIVEEFVTRTAVGFRTVRILTRILQLAGREEHPSWWLGGRDAVVTTVWEVLNTIDELCHATVPGQRLLDPYPARSFYVEALRQAALTARAMLDQAREARAAELLDHRFNANDHPIRERMYAAYALFELFPLRRRGLAATALGYYESGGDRAWLYLSAMFSSLDEQSVEQLLMSNIGAWNLATSGLDETAVSLWARENAGPLFTRGSGRTYLSMIPSNVNQAARRLIRYALLSPNGTARRRACEALRVAGLSREASGIIAAVLDPSSKERCPVVPPRWMRETSAFLLGVLGDTDSCELLLQVADDVHEDETVRHAAFFAVGDIGTRSETTVRLLIRHLDADNTPQVVAHAATYALAALKPTSKDEALYNEQLGKLAGLTLSESGADDVTRSLADWGVRTITRTINRVTYASQTEIWGLEPLRRQ